MKSLFSKVFLSSLLILVVGVSMLTFGLSLIYKNYIAEDNQTELTRLAEILSENINFEIDKANENFAVFHTELDKIEKYADIKIWLMFDECNIIGSAENINCDKVLNSLKQNEVQLNLNADKPSFFKTELDIYGGDEYYTLIYPVKNHYGNKMLLFLNKSIPNIDKKNGEITKFSFFTIIIIAIYASIIVSIFNKKIVDEIARLNRAVNDMAKGDLNVDLDLDRKDEFGELSRNLKDMGNSLDQIEQSRRKFVSNVSHDLRSPMTSISAYINGILDGTIPEDKWLHYLNIVSGESKRMIKLINNVLDLSKIQSGKYELKIEKIDINALILSLVDSYEQRIINKDIEMELDFMEGYNVFCDELLITRVLANLIDNAIKFSPAGASIVIRTEFKKPKAFVSVISKATYIEPEKLKFVWGRFNKLDDSRNLDKNSSGIGLAIVKEVISSHDEKIDLSSDETNGTCFKFSLKASKIKN